MVETPQAVKIERKSRTRRSWLLISALVLVLLALASVFRFAGSWLSVEDPLQPADAIVVLGGHLPFRAMEAAGIYKRGLASEVWVTRPAPTVESKDLEKLDIGFVPEDAYSVRVLIRYGVPSSAVKLIDGDITNTEDEVRAMLRTLRETGKTRSILVTSKYHGRRVSSIIRPGPLRSSNLGNYIVDKIAKMPYD
ncbi:MAG: YdcF family protein [Bryobacteraceae bacterium]|jgi:uncharacterized SAM-binding protein YcdF (DUF218 family)